MTKSVYAYRNGVLCVEALPLAEIAEDVDTPFYCMSAKQLQRNYRLFSAPFADLDATFHYALNANASLAIIRVLADCGAGAEICSAGELERALEGGISPQKIIMSGPGRTRDDVAAALLAGIMQINAESLSELCLIEEVASLLGKTAAVAVRFDADIVPAALAGKGLYEKRVKAGLDFDDLGEAIKRVMSSPHMSFKGLAVHLEPQGCDCALYRDRYQKLAMIVGLLREQGLVVERVDLGGGQSLLCDDKTAPSFSEYAAIVREIIQPLGCALSFAPSLALVGDAGVLVTRVLHVTETGGTTCLVLDAGVSDIVDSVLYNKRHEIIPVCETTGPRRSMAMVGPLCNAKDTFGGDYMMPSTIQSGDLVAIMQAGAYGSVLSSSFGGRAFAPEILVSGAQFAVVRRRVAVAEQMGWESIPDWMVIHRAA